MRSILLKETVKYMLFRIRELVPSLYPFLSQCYRQSSNLFFDDKIIISQVGAQQGDPAGSLLFSLSIHPIVTSLKSKLNLWYLDDGSICDKPDIVLSDFEKIIFEASKIGLKVNPSKCELYFCGEPNLELLRRFQTIAPGILVKSKNDLELLGSPIFDDSVITFTSKKFEKIETMITRLQDVKAHFAYYLLKNCLTIPKLSYLIRTAPLWKFPCLLQNIDTKIKIVLEKTLNVELNDLQWTQASLPVNNGGLGIRKLQDLSLPAFLASSFGVKSLVSTIINITDYETNLPNLKNALDCWERLNPEKYPIILEKQKQWNEINVERIVSSLVFSSEIDKFRFALLQNPFSGAWLNAVPCPNLGTFLNNETVRTCIGLRLGSKLCRPHKCICGDDVDSS
uniref:Reverse transcriptase domain-containing protein n=1 Tax=Cacopsylla melanoneura TaxID=428564 RepID=A0A8D8WTR2_9HEMI